jgi:hypothetical protein
MACVLRGTWLGNHIPQHAGFNFLCQQHLRNTKTLSASARSVKGFVYSPGGEPRLMSPIRRVDGYLWVALCHAGKVRQVQVHVLVLETFVGPRPPGMVCRHLNGVRADNRLENLAWGTYADNAADKARHGRVYRPLGSKNVFAKLTESDIAVIRRLLREGWSQKQIARRFNVAPSVVSRISSRVIWRHVA